MGDLLRGLGELLTGLAALGALVRSHQGAKRTKETKEVLERKVIPAIENHESTIALLTRLVAAAEQRAGVAEIFIADYQERHKEGK